MKAEPHTRAGKRMRTLEDPEVQRLHTEEKKSKKAVGIPREDGPLSIEKINLINVGRDPELKDILTIKRLPLEEDTLPNNLLQERGVIPKINSSVLICGQTGQGKTNLLGSLLVKPQFLKGQFHRVVIFAATGLADPTFEFIAKELKMKKDRDVITDTKMMVERLEEVLAEQKAEVEKHKGNKSQSKRIALVFEDVTANKELMASDAFIQAWVQNRHMGVSTFACCHKLRAVTRVCRVQAHNIFVFPPAASEVQVLLDEECPPLLTKKQFRQVIGHAWEKDPKDPKSRPFLHINKTLDHTIRYRRGLGDVITWTDGGTAQL